MLKKKSSINQANTIIREHVYSVYEEISATYRRGFAWRSIARKLPGVSSHSIILDAGCGSGVHSLDLAGREAYVVALDVSHNMLTRLVKQAKKRLLSERIDCLVGDMRFLPFRDYVFSHVIAIASIHHIPFNEERKRAIKEFCRVLKKNGVLLVSVWSLLQPRQFLAALKTWLARRSFEFGDAFVPWLKRGEKLERFYHLFTHNELKNLILSCHNLKILRVYGWNPKKSLFTRNFVVEAAKNG